MWRIFNKLRSYGIITFLRYTLSEVRLRVVNRWILGSYSQFKEDLIIDGLIGQKKHGFYVDIGAYEPLRFSNTMRFYKRGWHGITIEPNRELWMKLHKIRPRDTALNCGIGRKPGSLTFFSMDPPTLSTFSKKQALDYARQGFHIRSAYKVPLVTLAGIFKKYAATKTIDFLSLDVEGFEMEVLKSNDWSRFRPFFLCIETAVDTGADSKTFLRRRFIADYLKRYGYNLVYENGLNSIYSSVGS